MLQAFAPLLGTDRSRAGAPGRIINMSSVYGNYGMPWMGMYCASKFALEGLSHALRLEMQVHGIKVIVVRPGATLKPLYADAKMVKCNLGSPSPCSFAHMSSMHGLYFAGSAIDSQQGQIGMMYHFHKLYCALLSQQDQHCCCE